MAESIDKYLGIADVYAAALFDLAREADRIEATRRELDELVKLLELAPDFAAFLESHAIDPDKREAQLEQSFRGKLSDIVLNTLLVMNRHGRAGLTRALHRAFVLRQEQAAGQVEVAARTAVELNRAQQKEVHKVVEELSGKTPLIDFVVEPELLGGLVLEIGGWRYDDSVRQQLQAARANLLERGARGLEVGRVE